jgi:hypothetical protein
MEMEMVDGIFILFSYDFHIIFPLFSQIFISQFFPKLWDLARCAGAEPLGQRHRLARRRRASGPGYVAVGAGVEELLPWGPGARGRLGRLGRGETWMSSANQTWLAGKSPVYR